MTDDDTNSCSAVSCPQRWDKLWTAIIMRVTFNLPQAEHETVSKIIPQMKHYKKRHIAVHIVDTNKFFF